MADSAGDWLKTHRRQLSVHVSIILVFVLFIALAAEPLFDRLDRIPGEAQLHRLDLPTETGGMKLNIDEISIAGGTAAVIEGWAFVEGRDSENSKTYIVLRGDIRTYIFDTAVRERPDVIAHFHYMDLNLDRAGFTVLIPARKVARGEYVVGIYIIRGDIEALQYTDKKIEL